MRRGFAGVVAGIAVSLTAVASAHAATVVGALDPTPQEAAQHNRDCNITGLWVPTLGDVVLSQPPTPMPGWTVPAGGGVITAWSTNGQSAGARFRLAVTRFDSPERARVVAHSAIETIPSTVDTATFPTSIPVQGGEQLGLVVIEPGYVGDCHYPGQDSDEDIYITNDPGDGQETDLFNNPYEKTRLNVSAALTRGGPAAAVQCVVPRLKRRSVVRARKVLRKAHCALGLIHRARGARHARRSQTMIVRQHPPAGTVAPAGRRVTVTLGRRR
jgi:hypothetical protein